MASIAEKIYRHLPTLAQHGAISAYGLYWHHRRFGKHYKKVAADYRQRERFSPEEWRAYSQQKLREILLLAYTRVPYYREQWKGIVTAEQLKKFTVQDMVFLPPLEKAVVRDNPECLLIDGRPQKGHRVYHTSGSTGTPVATYWLPVEHSNSLALRHTRYSAFAGVGYDKPRATFSGRMVEPDPDSKGPYYRFNFVEKQVYFSAFHLGPKTVRQYVDALNRHKIEWVTGYTHSIYQMAQMVLDQQLELPPIKAVITTSEKLTPEMRSIIGEAFRSKVHEEYGCVENLFFACDNEYGQLLVSPDCGLIEIVDREFRPVAPEEYGEVLATGFIRPSQPMIRYRIGDLAAFSDEKPKCGRGMPVLREVQGRVEDTVYGPDGRRMVRFHGIFVDQPHIQEGQIIQEKLDLIRVKIVPKPGFGENDIRDISGRIQQRLTNRMSVVVEIVEKIERTKAGKFRAVICNLPPEELELITR